MKITKKLQISIVIAFPIINAIASTTQEYFNGFGTGDVRMLIISLFVIFTFHKFYKSTLINNIIILNLLYLFILVLTATDIAYTSKIFLKYFISTLMFPIGYYYIRDIKDYKRLVNTYLISLFIILFTIIIANIFSIGRVDYSSVLYFGAGGVNITKTISLLLLISPLSLMFIKNRKKKILTITILSIAFVLVLLGIKRTAISLLLIGFSIYIYIAPVSLKLIRKIIGMFTVLLLFSPLYLNILLNRFYARQATGRFELDQLENTEGRFIELNSVMTDFINGDIVHKLFGSELFNYMEFANTTRMLHTDYATIFSGSGLIGIFLFILIYILIFKKIIFYKKVFSKDKIILPIIAVCASLLIALLILGFAGTVHSIGIRASIFLFLGASFGVLNTLIMKYSHRKVKK